MSSKMGRPKAENPKDVDLKVRVDTRTHEKLIKYARENKISKAQAVRNGIRLLLDNKKE